MKNTNIPTLGGWSFEQELFDFVRTTLPDNSIILELGSGYGTHVLSKHYTMYSIEHNEKFIGKYKSTYIFAPMKRYWYDRDLVEGNLPEKYDMILVDGPIGTDSKNRIGFWENIDLFNTNVLMIFDDTNRDGERMLFQKVLDYCNFDFATEQPVEKSEERRFEIFKTFSVIYPK
jgi:hypothetical protein